MSVALAAQLREGTKKSHTMAENTGFVSCFLKGVVDKASYRKLVADLYFVYSAMEEEITKLADHPVVGPVAMAQLNRREALEQDLTYYFGESWKEDIKPSPSAAAYVERIHAVAQESPELLVGHHYTRYLGDLSGGQILKNIAQKAMNMEGDAGLRFYVFDDIADEKAFKTTYRSAMDTLPIDQAMADRIVEEANHAFHLNMNMFKELEQPGRRHRQGAVWFPHPPSAGRQHRSCYCLITSIQEPETLFEISGSSSRDWPTFSLWRS